MKVAMLLMLVAGLQLRGQAQGNLVNLYDWSNQTLDPYGWEASYNYVSSSTSATFYSGFTAYAISNFVSQPYPTPGSFSEILNTVPSATYEIAFATAGTSSFFNAYGDFMSFGDFTTNCSPYYNATTGQYGPVNFDYTVVASSSLTAISFNYYTMPGVYGMELSDFSVTEVPEMSGIGLFCFGGCIFILLGQDWGLVQAGKMKVHSP